MGSYKSTPRTYLLSLGFILFGLWSILYLTNFPEFIASKFSKPLDFKLRSLVKKSPDLDPRIKIYAFDDKTFSHLGYPDFSMDDWFDLIAQFARNKPRAIFIDKIFSTILQNSLHESLDPQKTSQFVKNILALNVPVTIGGFVSSGQIPGRPLVSLFHSDFSFKLATQGPNADNVSDQTWPIVEQGYFYGPHPLIREAFHVGHITNSDFGYIKPFQRLDPQSWIPHAALLALGALKIQNGKLIILDQVIPLNQKNLVNINFSSRETYFSRTKSLAPTIERINQKKPELQIAPGDVVVILPSMFTGNTDFKETPIGKIQGGYYCVAIMNSILSHSWLTESQVFDLLLIFGGTLCFVLAALYLPAFYSILVLFFGSLCLPLVGIAAFIWASYSSSWLFASLAATSSGLLLLIERIRYDNQIANTLLSTLKGALSPQLAESLAQDPQILHGEPVEQIVTIMFVDIVGFSLTTERQTPRMAFHELKSQLHYIIEKINAFDGLVDKSLGDGVLAFFGYHFKAGQVSVGHADRALQCAIAIQTAALQRALGKIDQSEPIYPLRIGINTATVYIGNLGTEGRIDFTLIGNGVNFTSRLEQACSPFKIMLGLASYDLLGQFAPNHPNFQPKDIQVKHHKAQFKCYEFHPFHGQEASYKLAMRYYRSFHKLYSDEPRWCLEPTEYLAAISAHGEVQIINFSLGGVALLINKLLIPGTKTTLNIPTNDYLANINLNLEVCWTRAEQNSSFIHGCQFQNINDAAAKNFVQTLRHIFKDSKYLDSTAKRSPGL